MTEMFLMFMDLKLKAFFDCKNLYLSLQKSKLEVAESCIFQEMFTDLNALSLAMKLWNKFIAFFAKLQMISIQFLIQLWEVVGSFEAVKPETEGF